MKNHHPPIMHIMSSAAPPMPMPTAAPVLRPPDEVWVGVPVADEVGEGVAEEGAIEEEEDVVVRSEVENVLENVGSLSVTQHVLHVLLAQTQSRSQSSSPAHESPRQCTSQVHTASAALLVGDACRVSDVMAEDIESPFNLEAGSARKRIVMARLLTCRI
jgi:hypothetical protein